jgi:hypothetical protein
MSELKEYLTNLSNDRNIMLCEYLFAVELNKIIDDDTIDVEEYTKFIRDTIDTSQKEHTLDIMEQHINNTNAFVIEQLTGE